MCWLSLHPEMQNSLQQFVMYWNQHMTNSVVPAFLRRRVVVLSSTSRLTNDDSSDPEGQATALRSADDGAAVNPLAANAQSCVDVLY